LRLPRSPLAHPLRPAHRRAGFFVVVLALLSAPAASAQAPQPAARVRVTAESATIWRPGFFTIDTVAATGAEFDVVSRRGDFFEVVLPASEGLPQRTGFVAMNQVMLIAGVAPPPTGPAPPPVRERMNVRGVGQVGYEWFAAQQGFEAVFGERTGRWFGGGVEFRQRGAFLYVSVERLRQTGERVFVFDDEVFRLGIPNTLTLTPVTLVVGYKHDVRSVAPYLGGGVGRYWISEESAFADAADNVDEQVTSYVALGGVEWHMAPPVAAAVELQYAYVPHELDAGAAAAFGEESLGGLQVRFKLLFGR
jgi:opacity protein-like surface antigen